MKYLILRTEIKVNSEYLGPGSLIELDASSAQSLVGLGLIRPAETDMPPSLGLSGEETPIDSSPEPIVPLTAVQQENAPKRLNLNTASKAELESIDLIGPATAKRLIAGRPYELLDQAREASLMPEAQWQQIEALLEVK